MLPVVGCALVALAPFDLQARTLDRSSISDLLIIPADVRITTVSDVVLDNTSGSDAGTHSIDSAACDFDTFEIATL